MTGKSFGLYNIGSHLFKKHRYVEITRQCCKFSSESGQKPTTGKAFQQPPLTESLPNLPKTIYSKIEDCNHAPEITKLPSGITIATEERYGQFCTVGVVIESGSRYEVAYPSGVSHFLEKLAFNATSKFKNKEHILLELEKHGGICDCQSTRDAFIYAASADRTKVTEVINIIADSVLRPLLLQEEVEIASETIKFEIENLRARPEQDLILTDMIHAAAYRDNTLGLPKLCPEKNLYVIDRSILYTYLMNHHTPSRMVVAGVGVEHNKLVEAVQKYFVDEKPIWETESGLVLPDRQFHPDSSLAQYTGGYVQEECTMPQFPGPSGLPELAHIVIGLEGTSYHDEDFIPLCVLNTMMGGGGSFSAGGPGKGMYTRLYTNVLNKHHYMFSATAFNHAYSDSGLFCIHASSEPDYIGSVTEAIVKEITNTNAEINDTEFSRAKKQLQSMLLMNLEARPVVFEDLARQVLSIGHKKNADYYINAINGVRKEDVIRVANRMLGGIPSVAARGNIKKVPTYENIQSGLRHSAGRMPKRIQEAVRYQ